MKYFLYTINQIMSSEAALDDDLLFSRDASVRLLLGGIVELTDEGNVGMSRYHHVTYLDQHQCQTVLFLCFNYLYMFICVLLFS